MNHLVRLITDNPGIFAMPLPATPLRIAVVIGCVLVVLGISATARQRSLVLSGLMLGVGVVILAGSMVTSSMDNPIDRSRNEYSAAVADWLTDEYGITATADVVEHLIDGEESVAEYGGTKVTISIIETTDGDLAVVDESGAPLTAGTDLR